MWITSIKLYNFRNYDCEEINLQDNINVFFGENAQGKTNIIESIYLSSIGKSFRTNNEKELIKFNFKKSDREGKIKIEIGNKKKYLFKWN